MSSALYELEMVGGPWQRRLARRRAYFDDLPWQEPVADCAPEALESARWVWTQSSFSEYASAASFAEIATALLAAGAPIDLISAAGEFVVDEMLHAELSARVAMKLGGAAALEVDLERLVRPAVSDDPLRRAAELVVRTSCVGEALTIPVLKTAAARSTSPLVEQVISHILRDESAHAEIGPWFLDWADDRLTEDDRSHLGRVASDAVAAFSPVLQTSCAPHDRDNPYGVLDCEAYDPTFERALKKRVVEPLAIRGIAVNV